MIFRRVFPSKRLGQKGQALVEFAILATLAFSVAFATFEVGRYVSLTLRIASSVREAGRLIVAGEIEPDKNLSATDNQTALQSKIETDVYDQVKLMISPADLDNQGKMIVSMLIRVDPKNNTDYVTASTAVDDYIKVEYQFIYPEGTLDTTRTNWVSMLGVKDTKVATTLMSTDTLRVGERTVMVEIFHKTNLIATSNWLKSSYLEYIYDKAVF